MGDVGGFCSGCPKNCCRDLSLAPMVFEPDKALLATALGDKAADCIVDIDGCNFLRRKEDAGDGCVFFDERRRCTMHPWRPRDCRFFPFDVIKVTGGFQLVLVCFCPNISNITQDMVDEALVIARDLQVEGSLDVYAVTELAEVSEGGFCALPAGLLGEI